MHQAAVCAKSGGVYASVVCVCKVISNNIESSAKIVYQDDDAFQAESHLYSVINLPHDRTVDRDFCVARYVDICVPFAEQYLKV